VDVLLLEVGVGGRFDATNVVARPVACAVNTLDLDHTAILGPTIDHIAWEKAGIMKQGVPCFTIDQPRGGFDVLRGKAVAPGASRAMGLDLTSMCDLGDCQTAPGKWGHLCMWWTPFQRRTSQSWVSMGTASASMRAWPWLLP
jgi:hypothetical protein